MVDVLRKGDEAERRRALGDLAAIYWPAVYSFLRKKGCRRDEASETTQAFFSDVVLQRNLFQQANVDRARLRSLLLFALGNFRIDQHRRAEARGESARVPYDESELETISAGSSEMDPEQAFHRRWASSVLEESLRRCERHFTAHDRVNYWAAYVSKVLQPNLHGTQPPLSVEVARELGFESATAVNNAVHTVKARQKLFIQQIAAETTSGEGEAEAEYRDLLAILS